MRPPRGAGRGPAPLRPCWDAGFEALVARIAADYAADADPRRDAAWIAELAGRRVGCVFCVRAEEPDVAQLRILLVESAARGQALGSRLVATAIEFATAAGYERMRLWTNHPLAAARRIYLAAGFRLTSEEAHHSFGVDLIGQTYELDLRLRLTGSSPPPPGGAGWRLDGSPAPGRAPTG